MTPLGAKSSIARAVAAEFAAFFTLAERARCGWRVAFLRVGCTLRVSMKLVKQQINGDERIVVKEHATAEDLRIEAAQLKAKLGYDIQPDGGAGRLIATHRHYRGKYLLSLEPD